MGDQPLPAAVLSADALHYEHRGSRVHLGPDSEGLSHQAPVSAAPLGAKPHDTDEQLERARTESDVLYGVISLIASSPDLDRVLDGVVSALTKATTCHACFVYLRSGDRLRMRAASRVYAQLVGEVEFGIEEGLAGWVVRRNRLAYIRENALSDPRTNYVPELEEERFQSMVAIPIPARQGEVIGAIVLHTIAPREFDEQTLNLLAHVAPLLAGAIENATLYAQARRRVAALTALSTLSQRIAAVGTLEELRHTAVRGARSLLGCAGARLYDVDEDQRLVLAASDPPDDRSPPIDTTGTLILLELAQARQVDPAASSRIRSALGLERPLEHALVVPVAAGEEHLGILAAFDLGPLPEDAQELMRAVANQVAVALKKAQIIDRLTEENVLGQLFEALELGRIADAQQLAPKLRCEIDKAHVFVHVAREKAEGAPAWPQCAERVDAVLRRIAPGAVCEIAGEHVRALLPLRSRASESELSALDLRLGDLGAQQAIAIGRSEPRQGAAQGRDGLREAADAAAVAAAIIKPGGALSYRELGAYRYLVHMAEDAPPDPYVEAVQTLAEYDRRRRSQLISTLEHYLLHRRRVTDTARALLIHPNTLRQRLERIEALTGLELARADLLALELAVKLARLRPVAR